MAPAVSGMGLSVRAVFFDLDNTLIDTAGASRKGMSEVTSGCPRPPGRSQRARPYHAPSPSTSAAPGVRGSLRGPSPGLGPSETLVLEGAGLGGWGGCPSRSTAAGVTCLSARWPWQVGFLNLVAALWDPAGCRKLPRRHLPTDGKPDRFESPGANARPRPRVNGLRGGLSSRCAIFGGLWRRRRSYTAVVGSPDLLCCRNVLHELPSRHP